MVKQYVGAHRVAYDGYNEGDGKWLWGVWNIAEEDRGGFHFWPAEEEGPTGRRVTTRVAVPTEECVPAIA